MDSQEKVFYKGSDVTVTQSRFLSGNKTYAMRNISSVEVGLIKAKKKGAILLVLLGILALLFEPTGRCNNNSVRNCMVHFQ